MDNNDSNIKSQQTGGLKLMTVFIAVLALHVVVIGGITIYHLMNGGSTDADLAATDKSHKSSTSTDTSSPDATQPDKTAPAPATATDVATIPANPTATTPAPAPAVSSTPATDTSAPTAITAPTPAPEVTPAPAPAPAVMTPRAPSLAPPPEVATVTSQTPSGPIAPDLAPPAEPAPAMSPMSTPMASTAPLASGPVHMPPAISTPSAPRSEREHGQIYTVKITDSYKKIAKAHHVTVAELKEANHIKGDVLHTGQKLIIPSGKTAVAETTSTPASPTTTAVHASLTGSSLSEAPASTASLAAAPHSHMYTVMKGDTLIKIAHKFKTTPSAIMAENSISDPARLTIGKKLKIPSRETRSAKNTEPAANHPSQVQAKEQYEPAPSSGQLANFVP